MSRLVRTAATLAAILALSGCGTAAGLRPGPLVVLQLAGPVDGSRTTDPTTTVLGSVHPSQARVQVLGHTVSVDRDGHFSATVALAVGTNLIDIEASAPRSVGAVAAVRVTRFVLITVPDVTGEAPAQADAGLRDLGLVPKIDSSSLPLSFLFPTSPQVCSSSPAAGAKVTPGATVTLRVSKFCGL